MTVEIWFQEIEEIVGPGIIPEYMRNFSYTTKETGFWELADPDDLKPLMFDQFMKLAREDERIMRMLGACHILATSETLEGIDVQEALHNALMSSEQWEPSMINTQLMNRYLLFYVLRMDTPFDEVPKFSPMLLSDPGYEDFPKRLSSESEQLKAVAWYTGWSDVKFQYESGDLREVDDRINSETAVVNYLIEDLGLQPPDII
jgi:hypothetical protein